MPVDWTTYSRRRIQDVEEICQDIAEKWEERDQWKIDHDNAMFSCDVDQALGEVCRTLSLVLDDWSRTKRSAASGRLPNFYAAHDAFVKLFRQSSTLCELATSLVNRVRELEYRLDNEEQFQQAAEQIVRQQSEVASHLPAFDHELMERARRDCADGRIRSVEELLNELPSSDSGGD